MKNRRDLIISIFLMVLSGIMLILAIFYYDLSDKIKEYHYSDKEEYNNVTEGIAFIKSLPIHLNIINKYFSNINNLKQEEKEEILLAYSLKNNYNLYDCGPSNNIKKYLCIDKNNLQAKELQEKFNIQLTFTSSNIKLYVDDYGMYTAMTDKNSSYYKITLDNTNNKLYRIYSEFSHYKQNKDIYTFYLYQGYYNGNCLKNTELKLYDFMSGKVVYKDTCNGNQEFTVDPGKNINKLQLYKYELKKDQNNKFYLYGYNPVNKIE